jgi:hypothetical protein
LKLNQVISCNGCGGEASSRLKKATDGEASSRLKRATETRRGGLGV